MSTDLVFNENGKALTNSLLVAKTFGKAHDKVLRDIRGLACSKEFGAANFGETITSVDFTELKNVLSLT